MYNEELVICKWCKKEIIANSKLKGSIWIHKENESTAKHFADADVPSPPGPKSYPRPKASIVA